MTFHVGQEVVCIDAKGACSTLGRPSGLKEGDTYVIVGLRKGCCDVEVDVGIPSMVATGRCLCGRGGYETNGKWWFMSTRFAPLEQDISELTEILSTTKPFEV